MRHCFAQELDEPRKRLLLKTLADALFTAPSIEALLSWSVTKRRKKAASISGTSKRAALVRTGAEGERNQQRRHDPARDASRLTRG